MLIRENISLTEFDDKGSWVINTPEDRNLLVNTATADLIRILKKSETLDEANKAFNTRYNLSIPLEGFTHTVLEKIGGYNILANDNFEKKKGVKDQYLKLKVQLFPAKIAGWLSQPFQFFFNPSIFWVTLVILLATLASILIATPMPTEDINFPMAILLVGLTTFIHELGHIGACARFKLKHGGIGFGFYYLMPVMYADITNIWNTGKQRRIIANLAGIFNEILYATILSIIYLYTGKSVYITSALLISTLLIWQLNPFVRFDGYWVISDITGTPNLMKKSGDQVKKFFKERSLRQLCSFKPLVLSKSEIFLILYGILNFIVAIGFMGFTLFRYRNDIIDYPATLTNMAQQIINQDISFSELNINFLVVTLFFFLAVKTLILQVKKSSLFSTKSKGSHVSIKN